MTPPRASVPKPKGKATKRMRMWIVVNQSGDMMRYPRWHKGVALGLADKMNEGHLHAHVSVRNCMVTWSSPLKRAKARKGSKS